MLDDVWQIFCRILYSISDKHSASIRNTGDINALWRLFHLCHGDLDSNNSGCANLDQGKCKNSLLESLMSSKPDHSWILSVLKDIEAYAEIHDQSKVAALVSAAGNAVRQVLAGDMTESHDVDGKEEQSFSVVLDELARYCHIHGLTETEEHLLAALDSWAMERRPDKIICNLLISTRK